MWDEVGNCDLILFTANSTVKDGKLVMGGGAALEARNQFKGADYVFGEILEDGNLSNGIFGLMFATDNHALRKGATSLGAFQTKTKVWEPSTLGLVEYSTHLLHGIAHNWHKIVLNMPGTGLGGLAIADVMPIVETLPDNVVIYTFAQENVAKTLQIADEVTQKIIGNPLT